MSVSVSAILGKLKRTRKNGPGWVACCPAHEDRTPSLSISVSSDGKIEMVYLKAKCTILENVMSY